MKKTILLLFVVVAMAGNTFAVKGFVTQKYDPIKKVLPVNLTLEQMADFAFEEIKPVIPNSYSSDWDKNWKDYARLCRAQIISGLSSATSGAVYDSATAEAFFRKNMSTRTVTGTWKTTGTERNTNGVLQAALAPERGPYRTANLGGNEYEFYYKTFRISRVCANTIVGIAIPEEDGDEPGLDEVPGTPTPAKDGKDAVSSNNFDALAVYKDGLLTGSLLAKNNCCGTTTTTTLPQTTYPQIVLPQTTYPQQVIYPQQPQVVYQQPRGERIVNGIVRVLDAIVPDNLSINVNQSTSVISNSGNTQYSYPTTQTQYPQQQYPQQQYPQQPVITQSQNVCPNGSQPTLWTYPNGQTQYICPSTGGTTNPGNGTVITQQPQLPGNTNEPGSGQTPPIIIKPGNTNDPAFQAGIGMNNLRTVNNQTQGLNSNGSFMNQNQNQGLTSNGAFASGLQN